MRSPAWDYRFYPGDPEELSKMLAEFFSGIKAEELPAIGAVVPHAGYEYSGAVAAEVYARLPQKETYIILGPNHSDRRNLVAAMSKTPWKTPLGTVEVDMELADSLAGSIIEADEIAHSKEHSIEVQIPFLQSRFSGFKILPISIGGMQEENAALEIGHALGEAIKELKRDCVIIASSDFTHQLPAERARKIDTKLIESILSMDISEFYSRIYGYDASVCGYGPIAAAIKASQILGATKGKLLRYATSGEITRDDLHVVGYGAIVFT